MDFPGELLFPPLLLSLGFSHAIFSQLVHAYMQMKTSSIKFIAPSDIAIQTVYADTATQTPTTRKETDIPFKTSKGILRAGPNKAPSSKCKPRGTTQGFCHYADQYCEILHWDGIAGYYEEIQKLALGRSCVRGESYAKLT